MKKKTSNKSAPKKSASKKPAKTASKTVKKPLKQSNAAKTTAKKPVVKKTVAKKAPAKTAVKKQTKPVAPKSATNAKPVSKQNGLVTVEIKIHSDAKGGHPHVMLGQVQDKNVSVGITHSAKKGKKHSNIPLQHNPLGEDKPAYMRKQGTVDKKTNYGSSTKVGKMTKSDNAKAKQIGEKAKQKHLRKQSKK